MSGARGDKTQLNTRSFLDRRYKLPGLLSLSNDVCDASNRMLSEDPCDANLNDRTLLDDPRMRLLSLCGEGETTQESVSGLGSPVARTGAGHIDVISSSAACEGAA